MGTDFDIYANLGGHKNVAMIVQDLKNFFNLVAQKEGYSREVLHDVFADLRTIMDFHMDTSFALSMPFSSALGSAEVSAIKMMRDIGIGCADPAKGTKFIETLYRAMEETSAMRGLEFKPAYKP